MNDKPLLSTGDVAILTGESITNIKFWDRQGAIVPAMRVGGRRAWRATDVPELQRQIAELRARNPRRRMDRPAA